MRLCTKDNTLGLKSLFFHNSLKSHLIMKKEKGEIHVRNSSMSLSPTLTKIEKVEHYIRIKTYKSIVLRFWVESAVSILCGQA